LLALKIPMTKFPTSPKLALGDYVMVMATAEIRVSVSYLTSVSSFTAYLVKRTGFNCTGYPAGMGYVPA